MNTTYKPGAAHLTTLLGHNFGPAAGGAPAQIIILVHGLGSDGADLIGLAPAGAAALPHALFLAPNGPDPHDMGGPGRQWFSMRDYNPNRFAEGVRRAAPSLDAFIDAALEKYHLPADAYALLGFSQGAMTVLFAGLRRKTPPRAIVAIAGALLAPQLLRAELTYAAPVLLIHGEADTVVPAARSREAQTVLHANNIPVETLFIPGLGHSIDQPALARAVMFLRQSFA